MTDRELLERAAKAAGMKDAEWQDMAGWGEVRHGYSSAIWSGNLFDEGGSGYWNPLTDDGDALRLAVRLKIRPKWPHTGEVWAVKGKTLIMEDGGTDICAATRRAIVRAAAEMAK